MDNKLTDEDPAPLLYPRGQGKENDTKDLLK